MKTRQLRSPRLQKCNKRTSETEPEQRGKIVNSKSEEEYLSPMHIKLPKGKAKNKKEVRFSKTVGQFDEKTTKRKEKKKPMQECNGSSSVNENAELIETIKYDKALLKTKAKITEKTLRNSSKNNTVEKCLFTDEVISTKIYSKASQKKHHSSKLDIRVPQEEYLFIGDEFFLINNYYPTKRLLNTFREVCMQDSESKFITQDKGDKLGKQRLDFKRNNIFVAARKEIQMKNKVKKVIKLQRWWRRMIEKHNLGEEKPNPEMTVNASPIKYNFDSFDEINSITPIKPYLQDLRKDGFDEIVTPKRGIDDIDIVSFNSTDMMQEKPKKIEFKQEDLSKMLMGSYRLPQNDVDHHENQEVFSSYTRFRISQAEINNYSQSQDSSQNLLSPKKDDVYPREPSPQSEDDRQNGLDLLRQFQQATRIKQLIDQRIIMQKGQVKPQQKPTKIGINTSILSIHTMLVNFFHFYINKYRDEFLSLVNMPYGHSIDSRLKALRGIALPEDIQQDDSGIFYGLQNIIDDEKLEEYFKFVEVRDNRMCSSFSKANFELEKIQFKAVVDYFNREINEYRPYRQISGIPYPWNHSYKALTFYFVTEDNIAEVFEKAELKVLKASSLLCGIIIPELEEGKHKDDESFAGIENFMEMYQSSNNGLILEHNDTREVKLIHEEVKGEIFQYDCQLLSGLLLDISNEVVNQLMLQAAALLSNYVGHRVIY